MAGLNLILLHAVWTEHLNRDYKVAQRTEIPKWIAVLRWPPAFAMRSQGDWDPPAAGNPEYMLLTNALPYLDKLAAAYESSAADRL